MSFKQIVNVLKRISLLKLLFWLCLVYQICDQTINYFNYKITNQVIAGNTDKTLNFKPSLTVCVKQNVFLNKSLNQIIECQFYMKSTNNFNKECNLILDVYVRYKHQSHVCLIYRYKSFDPKKYYIKNDIILDRKSVV